MIASKVFGKRVRTVMFDGEPWFVAKDVPEVLRCVNPQQAIRLHCKKARPVGVLISSTLNSQTIIIPEPDVYRMGMRSKLPSAERFENWVIEEVIPTARKTGGVHLCFGMINTALRSIAMPSIPDRITSPWCDKEQTQARLPAALSCRI